jgi:hypothetical protein
MRGAWNRSRQNDFEWRVIGEPRQGRTTAGLREEQGLGDPLATIPGGTARTSGARTGPRRNKLNVKCTTICAIYLIGQSGGMGREERG